MTASREQLKRDLARLAAGHNRLAERIAGELEFAEGLARLHPDKAGRWARLIEQATAVAARAAAGRKVDRLPAAVREAEAILAPLGKAAKQYTLHCVGHAHIDMNWMWSWPETVAVTHDTFLTMLKLMDEFPDFTFTQSQASVYALVRDYNPALLNRIRARIAEGRWEVAASHWVEGDKNLAGGEALARHLLYTRRFMKETFGLEAEDVAIDWSPDTFGHAHTIPTIDARGGVRWYYMCRGGAFEKPPVFWWQGPDGSRLLVNLETTWYNDHIGPHNALAMLKFCEKTGLVDWMNVYGVGDHGGGPTRRDIVRAHDMDAWPIYPHFRFASTRDFYPILENHGDRWPVLDRELNYEFTGCYTSQALIKHANRCGENYCVEAEAVAAVARRAAGSPYPAGLLREAWINTLFGHFHDILPGSGVRATRDYQLGLFQKTTAATSMAKTQALRALAERVNTAFAAAAPAAGDADAESIALGGGAGRGTWVGGMTTAGHVTGGPRAFLVFNPTAWKREEIVTATLWDIESNAPGTAPKSFVVRTAGGRTLPAQRLAAGHYWGHDFVDLAVPAGAGALGYSTYIIEEGDAPPAAGGVTCGAGFRGGERQPEGEFTLENEFLAVAFDRETGGIMRLLDKATGLDLASPAAPTALPEYILERPRGMSAWLLGDAKERRCPLPLEAFGPDQRGPLLASMVAKLKLNDSAITITYALKAGQPWLEITMQARWVERGGPETGTPSLVMMFPLALAQAAARYEIPFGSVERDLARGEEVPALRWADVTGRPAGGKSAGGGAAGCALLNDSKYGHSLTGATLRLTLIRSSYEPDPLPEIGDHTIRMALVPHGKPLAVADLVRLGSAFNHPLLVAPTDVHGGPLPAAAAFVAAGPGTATRRAGCPAANVVLSSVRQAQDNEDLIFHLFETAGRRTVAKVALDAALAGAPAKAVEVDFLERPLAESSAKVTPEGFAVTVPAHGIAAVKVSFTK